MVPSWLRVKLFNCGSGDFALHWSLWYKLLSKICSLAPPTPFIHPVNPY